MAKRDRKSSSKWGKSAKWTKSKNTTLLVVGFDSGVFGLYELPDFNNIHTLSISQKRVTTVAVSPSGEWFAFTLYSAPTAALGSGSVAKQLASFWCGNGKAKRKTLPGKLTIMVLLTSATC